MDKNTNKSDASVDNKEHGVHKENHQNQYRNQGKDDKNIKKVNTDVSPKDSTITGDKNPVQDNAHKNAKQKSESD